MIQTTHKRMGLKVRYSRDVNCSIDLFKQLIDQIYSKY